MALNTVTLPFTDFRKPAVDRPIFNASIYVGAVDTDPELPGNQILVSVLEENGDLTPIAQPLTTGPGGYIVRNGAAVQVVVEDNYSLKVLDDLGEQVYYIPDRYAADAGGLAEYIPLTGTVPGQDATNAIVWNDGSDRRYTVGLNLLFPEFILLGKTQGSGGGGVIITATDEITTSNWIFDQTGETTLPDFDYSLANTLSPLPKKNTVRTAVETYTSYGQVNGNGIVQGGTGDFSVFKEAGLGLYRITFDVPAVSAADQVLMPAVAVFAIGITAVGAEANNEWLLQIADAASTPIDAAFVFTRHARVS